MSNIYIPPQATNMKTVSKLPLFVGIQGAPASGKTWAALTFPNPIVIDLDRSLTAHRGKDITVLPFYDKDYCLKTLKTNLINGHPNKRDALLKFVKEEAPKLSHEQTLVIDSWTAAQNAFEMVFIQPFSAKTGKPDEYAFWGDKMTFSRELLEACKCLNCNVVITFHEFQELPDKETGRSSDKLQPLMQGKFQFELKSYFTDFIRQVCVGKKDKYGRDSVVNGQKLTEEVAYFWQIKSDSIFDAKTRCPKIKDVYIPANYQALLSAYNDKV